MTRLLPLILLVGCNGYAGPRAVSNPDPAVKVPLVKRAVEGEDRAVAPQLVRDLDDDDPAVRFYAIEGLRRLNGGDKLGYDWTARDADRQEASTRWKQWLAGKGTTS